MKKQESAFQCSNCGRAVLVRATDSPYEFEADCQCGRSYALSWTHEGPPPQFEQWEDISEQRRRTEEA
jgi:hypothetical protein